MPALSQHLLEILAQYGVLAMFLSVTLESLGAPLPGESALLAASAAASRGEYHILTVFLTATAASALGNTIGYLIGLKVSRETLVWLGGKLWIPESAFDKTDHFMKRYGVQVVLFARFLVGLRQLNGLFAGMYRLPMAKFQAANIVGAVLWVGTWCTIGYKFGHELTFLPKIWHHLNYVAAAGVILLLLTLAWHWYRKKSPRTS